MSQKQKSILSFFKQAEPSNTSKKPGTDNDSKNANLKKDLKTDDSKKISPKCDSKAVKKVEKISNGSDCKKSSVEKSSNKNLNDESPVKQIKKRKRAKILDSDDDSQSSDEMPNKKHTTDKHVTNGNHNNDCNGNEDEKISKPTKSEMDTNESKSKSRLSDDDVQQDEPMEEDKIVSETNDKVPSNKEDKLLTSESSATAPDENVSEIIPKRKTARKQMRGGQMKMEERKKISADSDKAPDTNVDNKSKTLNADDNLTSEEQGTEKSENYIEESSPSLNSNLNSNKTKEPEVKDVEKESPNKDCVSDVKVESGEKDVETNKKSPKAVKDKNSNKKPRKSKDLKSKLTKKDIKSPKEDKDQVSKNVKEELRSDSDEDTKNEVKSPKAKAETESNSKKKAIHPFFASNKTEEVSVKEGNTEKKTAKASTSTGMVYDPSKNHYHPIDDACWKQNEKVPYLALAKTLELIENISGRLKIVEILANYFRSVIVLTPEDLLQSVYLCLNRLAPEYEGIELGIGELLLMKALAQATGRTTDKIKAEVAIKGDLGLVAETSRGNQRLMFAPPKLTVSAVFSKFKEIAKMSGNSAMAKKTDKIQALFVACRECEAKYIIRSLSGKLRIGLAEQSVLAALARAAVLTPPNQSFPPEIIDKSSKMSSDSFKEYLNAQTLILKTTYCECPNYDLVIPVLLKEGIAGLPEHCQLTAGFPLKPMLAHPTNGIEEVLNRFDKNEFTCEFKYDGERAQIHMTEKGEIKIYSRNQEDNTSKYPDVISRLSKTLKETTKSFIMDSEAVAWDSQTKQILTFQVLSTRKKKDAVESDIVVQVCIMAFDLIYLNGESLVKKPLKERRDLLHSAFIEVENEFMFATYKDGNSAETMQEFLDESIKGNCEGLMVKSLTVDASYEIAKRSHNWLKLKKDYLAGIGDTLDLVVIGGYHGKGKRAGTFGGFLLACYDDENEEFQSICKLGTGFSDTDLETHTKFFKEHIIEHPKSYYRYDSSLEPDVWFNAVQIWEIKCADLSISPIHKAAIGIVDPEKGISLRFPRFLRIRDDKSKPEDATVSSEIANMYQKQDQVQNSKKNTKNEEDYY